MSARFVFYGDRVLPLKECAVEVVARDLTVRRVGGTTVEAAVRARP